MKCKKCGFQNELQSGSAKFCTNCGSPLGKKNKTKAHKNNKQVAAQNSSSIKKLWIGAAILLGMFLTYSIVDSDSHNSNLHGRKVIESKNTNPFIEAKVYDIASKFVCGCKGCNEDPLDECKCDFAMEERQFIRNALERKEKEEDIIKAVNKKYGGLKKS